MAALIALSLSFLPFFSLFAYPFRLLATMIHELGHGLAAVLTGGQFVRFVVFPDGSGVAYTAGGWRWLIIPAGYVGVALFSAGLILIGRNLRRSRQALIGVGGALILLTLLYGLPTLLSAQFASGFLTVMLGILFGIGLVAIARRAAEVWSVLVLNLLAFQTGLTAFSDIWWLVQFTPIVFPRGQVSDAQAMAQLTFIPAVIWAILWAVLACGLIGGALWQTWFRRRS
jgi:hypothetical protein